MIRRARDVLLLNAAVAVAHHVMVLAVRLFEARSAIRKAL